MHRDLARQIATSTRPVSLTVGAVVWSMHVFGATRIGRDSFVQIALFGPRTCTITVRTPAVVVRNVTARQVLDAVGDWLAAGHERDHAWLELPEMVDRAVEAETGFE
jgi:hypothetical protein